ncbi:MAG: mannose-1-phosphate guanylyltransferase/mannose-6-phosphate isomerase [Planctomycetota bacterium]|jgi:mannose-1-phosphate guanylyltransferase|nr:mannose-1-phosphate guanylyltransferase/mannose-6-phosphate isomerase [Planctomycetota bacterium]
MIAVILCGGKGARLWPLSRETRPKPFFRLPDGQTLLEKAYARASFLPDVERVVTVANAEYYFLCAEEYEKTASRFEHDFLLEPCGRNTGPAIAAALLEAGRRFGDDAVMTVLPSDHLILDGDAFQGAVSLAKTQAERDRVVVFGIAPTGPETGYGYIEHDGDDVVRFVEKPDREKAAEYLASGRFLWNSGMFCFKAGVLREEYGLHASGIIDAVEACFAGADRRRVSVGTVSGEAVLFRDDEYASLPAESIDYAVMEKSRRLAVVPCSLGWSDLGSWPAWFALAGADASGNRILDVEGGNANESGDALVIDSANCDLGLGGRLAVLLGVEGLTIVDTPDAVLVADTKAIDGVKDIAAHLARLGHDAGVRHRAERRPWGERTLLGAGTHFRVCRLDVKPGAEIPEKLHCRRSEHWVVVQGRAEVVRDGDAFVLAADESAYIAQGRRHVVRNIGDAPLVLIEIQSGGDLEDDDTVVFGDDWPGGQILP